MLNVSDVGVSFLSVFIKINPVLLEFFQETDLRFLAASFVLENGTFQGAQT